MFWRLSIPGIRGGERRREYVDVRMPPEVLFALWTGADGGGMDGPAVCWSIRTVKPLDDPPCVAEVMVTC